MDKKWSVTKTLAAIGTVLVWFPIVAPILLSLVRLISGSPFNFDFLMPAELFMVVILGGVLLIWAAVRVHLHLKLVAWSLGVAIAMLVGGQALAAATGLASGAAEPVGFGWAVVVASILIYTLAVLVLGLGGVMLIRDLWKPRPQPA
jgi:hypothetical protein